MCFWDASHCLRAVVPKSCLDQQHQYHLGMPLKCKSSGNTMRIGNSTDGLATCLRCPPQLIQSRVWELPSRSQFNLLTVTSKALDDLVPPYFSKLIWSHSAPSWLPSHSGLPSSPRKTQDLPTSSRCKFLHLQCSYALCPSFYFSHGISF